jgi:glycosyltransferase involved in cell wall biosynthesis
MNILINALSAKQGGGQTYVRNLVANAPKAHEATIYVIAPPSLVFPSSENVIRLAVPQAFTNNPYVRTIWEALALPKLLQRLRIDVLFCPGGSVPMWLPKRCKVVTTFQNMMPFDHKQRAKYPFGLMRVRNWILERTLLSGMRRSDLVIFISEFAKSVIESRLNKRRIRYAVIPHGIDSRFRMQHGLSKPSWLPDKDYFLYVSTLDVYKAQIEVVEAYQSFRKSDAAAPKLVLVGPEYKPYGDKVRATVAKLGLQDDVLFIGNVPHGDLPAAYQNARINIFASETENCPFILLEALCAGRPVLVSSRPPMPEFGGDAVVYFDPSSSDDLAYKLSAVNSSAPLMAELGRKALVQSDRYQWEETGRRTWRELIQVGGATRRDAQALAA